MKSLLLKEEVEQLIQLGICEKDIAEDIEEKLVDGNLTRDEGSGEHFCIYFAAFDPVARKIFLGHHKKSGLWLFNGGHIDRGEGLLTALKREMGEEWGLSLEDFNLNDPSILTITPINTPSQPLCKTHYDIWYFISVSKEEFNPDEEKLGEEFYETRWVSLESAKMLVIEKNTIHAINSIEKYFK